MLNRDQYEIDPIIRYFPDYSLKKYVEHIEGRKPYYRQIFTKDRLQRWKDIQNTMTMLCSLTVFISLIPVITHNYIPWLNKFTSKKARILWTLGFIFIPANLVSLWLSFSNEAEIVSSYQIQLKNFKKYRETASPQIMNSFLEQCKFI